jgi:hypothetical protein
MHEKLKEIKAFSSDCALYFAVSVEGVGDYCVCITLSFCRTVD